MPVEQKPIVIKFQASPLHYTEHKTTDNEGKQMIEQTATVISVESGYAWVMPQQAASGCGGCASKASCTSGASPFSFMHKEPQKMRVLNPSYARPGDVVVVGMQGEALVMYSLLAYMLPLLGMLLMAILGRELAAFGGVTSEFVTVFSGLVGLVGGLRLANVIGARSLKSNEFQPVILRGVGQPLFADMAHLA
jgi:sigma-E factor negative regulatory protein RseC